MAVGLALGSANLFFAPRWATSMKKKPRIPELKRCSRFRTSRSITRLVQAMKCAPVLDRNIDISRTITSTWRSQMNPDNAPLKKSPTRVGLPADDKLLVGRQEAAELLSISQRALDYLVANKQLQVRRIGTRVLIPRSELYRFVRGDHPERLAG
jgi:excisionase family DNA binding protein